MALSILISLLILSLLAANSAFFLASNIASSYFLAAKIGSSSAGQLPGEPGPPFPPNSSL
jgi:hypothetical protein